MWRSDCTRGEVIEGSYAATLGFYELVDSLAREIPRFQWENCSGEGLIKDYGAMRRAVKIFNSDTYSALHVRQAFYDSSHVLHPMQLEGHLGSTDGAFRPRGESGIKYAFRSTSMGAPEWFLDAPNGGNGTEPWTQEERDVLRGCVETYKARIRPLVRYADLYHIFPRPDGAHRGVIYLFLPTSDASNPAAVRFRGLRSDADYRIECEEGTLSPCIKSGAKLMRKGLSIVLKGNQVSELVFFERVRTGGGS